MVTRNDIENAIKIIDGVVIDFSETVNDLMIVKNLLYKMIGEPDHDEGENNEPG
jgi:hypothetical protein